jgi:hypothetical protein
VDHYWASVKVERNTPFRFAVDKIAERKSNTFTRLMQCNDGRKESKVYVSPSPLMALHAKTPYRMLSLARLWGLGAVLDRTTERSGGGAANIFGDISERADRDGAHAATAGKYDWDDGVYMNTKNVYKVGTPARLPGSFTFACGRLWCSLALELLLPCEGEE